MKSVHCLADEVVRGSWFVVLCCLVLCCLVRSCAVLFSCVVWSVPVLCCLPVLSSPFLWSVRASLALALGVRFMVVSVEESY